jgi:hypothetical protein
VSRVLVFRRFLKLVKIHNSKNELHLPLPLPPPPLVDTVDAPCSGRSDARSERESHAYQQKARFAVFADGVAL